MVLMHQGQLCFQAEFSPSACNGRNQDPGREQPCKADSALDKPPASRDPSCSQYLQDYLFLLH